MTIYYLSAEGSDDNSGLSLDLAWKTVAKLNSESLTFSVGDTVVINTENAPFVLDDELIVRDDMTVIGVGNIPIAIIDKDGNETTVTTTAADIRAYRYITGVFYQPDSETYPNVWRTDDAEDKATLFKFDGWGGNVQPLTWLNRIQSDTNPASTINSTENSYWCEGSYIDFYYEGDPNLDSSFVRSFPGIVRTAITVAGGGALFNVACGGALETPRNSSTTSTTGYAIRCNIESSKTTTAENIFAYCSNTHLFGVIVDIASNGIADIKNVRFEQGPIQVTNVPSVIYGTSGTGNRVSITGICNVGVSGVFGSTEGINSDSVTSLYMHNQDHATKVYYLISITQGCFTSGFSMGDPLADNVRVYDMSFTDRVKLKSDSAWYGCKFKVAPQNEITGLTTLLESSFITTEGISTHAVRASISGDYTVRNCTLDARGHVGANQDSSYFIRTGAVNFSVTNCLIAVGKVKDSVTEYADMLLCYGLSVAEDTYNFNYNAFWTKRNDSTGTYTNIIKRSDGAGVDYQDILLEGHEANGLYRYNGEVDDLYGPFTDLANLVPSSTSPLVGAGAFNVYTTDYYGNPSSKGRDIGAYEYQFNSAEPTSNVYLGPLKYSLTNPSEGVYKWPSAPVLTSVLGVDNAVYNADGTGKSFATSTLAVAAMASLADDSQIFSGLRGTAVYSTDQSANADRINRALGN